MADNNLVQQQAMINALMNPQDPAAQPPNMEAYARNSQYAQPPSVMKNGYQTSLDPLQEMAFQQWVKDKQIPFDPSPTADYDMRGFYQAQLNGDPSAQTTVNANDGMPHFTDPYKTPYHESFSAESKYAGQGAPNWNAQDQLVMPDGQVVLDERQKAMLSEFLRHGE